jgi:hypothetical protein
MFSRSVIIAVYWPSIAPSVSSCRLSAARSAVKPSSWPRAASIALCAWSPTSPRAASADR